MAAISDPKHVAAMLVGQMDPHGSHGDDPGGQPGNDHGDGQLDPGEEAAGEEMMQALQANDVASFVSALKSFLQLV